jgi:hypothetical protein
VRIVDVTGEGLPDFLKCDTAGQCKAWINTGSGWKLNDNWKPPIAISHWNDSGNFDSQCLSKLCKPLLCHIVNNQPNHHHSHLQYVIAYMSGTNNIDNGVRIVDVTGDCHIVNNQPNHHHSHLQYERHNPSQLPNNYQQ